MNNTENTAKTNWVYLVIAFLLAVVIWAIADENQTARRDTTIKDIPIEYLFEDTTLANRGLMLLEDSDETVDVKLEGPRTIIADLDPDIVRVQVDLSSVITTGRQNVSYRISYVNSSNYFNSNLSNVSTSNTVSVNIGALSKKDVEIRYDIYGNVATGYIAGSIQLEPDVLEIQGIASEVNAVSYAHVSLNIDDATETVSEALEYVLYDANDQPVTEHNLRVSADRIQVTMPVNVIKEIPLKIDFVEDVGSRLSNVNWKLEPSSITVYGDAAALINVDSILLDTIVLAGLDGDMTFNYVIPLPDGCENLSGVSRAELKFSFKDLLIEKIPVRRFEFNSAPRGKVVTVLNSQVEITLRGTSADIRALGSNDITLVADLSDISSASGNYTVPAIVELAGNGDIAIIGTYQLRVNISEPPPEPEPEPVPDPNTPTDGTTPVTSTEETPVTPTV